MKPPIGIMPRFIHDEKRLYDIKHAIERYTAILQPIPPEWIEEYNKLVGRSQPNESTN